MKDCLVDRKGVALVMALLVIIISAGLLAAVTYYSLSGTEISGLQRKYQSSKEASLGGIDILTKEIIPKAVVGATLATIRSTFASTSILPAGSVILGVSDACFTTKMNRLKTAWSCPADTNPMDPTSQPDITFRLRSTGGDKKDFQVELKIIDTRPGNTDISGSIPPSGPGGVRGLDAKGVVALQGSGGGSGGGSAGEVIHIPFLYTIVAEGRSVSGPVAERADFEVLYAY